MPSNYPDSPRQPSGRASEQAQGLGDRQNYNRVPARISRNYWTTTESIPAYRQSSHERPTARNSDSYEFNKSQNFTRSNTQNSIESQWSDDDDRDYRYRDLGCGRESGKATLPVLTGIDATHFTDTIKASSRGTDASYSRYYDKPVTHRQSQYTRSPPTSTSESQTRHINRESYNAPRRTSASEEREKRPSKPSKVEEKAEKAVTY
jgi:hypothetical protein